MPLFVDTRWKGRHGIARVSSEVLARLELNWHAIDSRISPSSPADVFCPARVRLRSQDVVYSPGYNAGPSRATQLVTVHDLIHFRDSSQRSLAKVLYYEMVVAPAVRKAGIVFTVSETSRRGIQNWLRDPSVEVVNVGNGCSDAFFPAAAASPEDHSDERLFVMVGNPRSHKNCEVALKAIALVPMGRLIWVVSDVVAATYLVQAMSVEKNVTVCSNMSDQELASLYRSAEALLFPSTLEGFGLPALESLACGTPVIYWQGCESIAEICGSLGFAVESSSDQVIWKNALLDTHPRPSPAAIEALRASYSWERSTAAISAAIASRL